MENLSADFVKRLVMTKTEAVVLLNRLIGVESDLKKLQIYEFIKNELLKPARNHKK